MNKISATIIKDSINPQGNRLTTFELIFPRYILAELNTHRVFSKNSASSRAIPFNKMVEAVQNDPFIPIAWQKDHSGMQGSEYITDQKIIDFKTGVWLKARDEAVHRARELNGNLQRVRSIFDIEELEDTGVTKQLCNRLLEPFMYHKVLLTATEFDNFFDLRCPKYITPVGGKDEFGKPFIYHSKKEVLNGHSNPINIEKLENFSTIDWLSINQGQAEIHIMDLAEKMYDAYQENKPVELKEFEWHSPYDDNILSLNEYMEFIGEPKEKKYSYVEEYSLFCLKISVARCARLSYQTIGDNPKIDYLKDLELYDSLLENRHWSPFEHVALCSKEGNYANFKGFKQLRSLLEK